MKLNAAARELIGEGVDDAILVTLNPDGSPQATMTWMALRTNADGDDELVSGHLAEHQKVRNVRRDSRVVVSIPSHDKSGAMEPYLLIKGTARVVEGGAPEFIRPLAKTLIGPDAAWPPEDAPAGYLTVVRIDKVGGVGPWIDR
ncbi:MAG: TIGR03618 family F420-dependent PPOX class oxidoreductase [Mycobacterium sp.]